LAANFASDIIAALGASSGVAPLITIADRAIIYVSRTGAMKLTDSMKTGLWELVTRPDLLAGRPEFRLILSVYFATYTTTNVVTNAWKTCLVDSWPVHAPGIGSLVALIPCHIHIQCGASVAKDATFTGMFGTMNPRPMPLASLPLFSTRDGMTIAAR
ncbi:unnamed protein product, partial [Discosporangium mesarthrocarpum]